MSKLGSCEPAIVGLSGLVALMLVLFADLLPLPFGGYADQRFALIVLSGLLSLLSIVSYAWRWPVNPVSAFRVWFPTLLLCVAYLLLSLPYLSQPYAWVEPGMYGFFFLSTFAAGAMLCWAASGVVYSRYLPAIIAACCTFYGLASINVYLFAVFDGVTDLVDFIPWGFVNIRYWSHIATWCLPLMPLAVLVGPLKENRLWQGFVLLGAGLWWWILLLTTGRGSALGIVFGVVLAVCLFGRHALPWLKVFLKYLVAGILIWLILSVAIPSLMAEGVQVRTIKADSSGRMPLFVEAWAMSLQSFPLGMGPQSWLTHELLTDTYANSRKFGHPHNMYLMWAAEYGWLLMAALGLVVVQAVRYFWQKRRQVLSEPPTNRVLLLAGFTASVSAALFHAGVSAVFMAPGSMLIGMFVLIAFWALIIPAADADDSQPNPQSVPAPWKRAVIAIIVSAVLLTAWFGWAREVAIYHQDMRQDEESYYEEGAGGILPRFWFHGNFPRQG